MDITQGITTYEIENSSDLSKLIHKEIVNCDYLIMNAAVADFKISQFSTKKIPKSQFENFLENNIKLVPDILKETSKLKKQHQIFVGFCAFTGSIKNAKKSIQEKIIHKGCDYLFANPIDIEGQGFGALADNEGWLFDKKDMVCHFKKTTKLI